MIRKPLPSIETADSNFGDLAKLFTPWMEKGWIRRIDLKALSGLFLSLFYFIMHHEDIGKIDFEGTKELLIDMLAGYLIIAD